MLRKGSHAPFLINQGREWRKWKAESHLRQKKKSDVRSGKICYFRSQILQSVSLLCSLILDVKILQGTTQQQSSESLDVFQPADVKIPIPWFRAIALCPGEFPEHNHSSGPPQIPPPPALLWDSEQDWTRLLILELMRWIKQNCFAQSHIRNL